MVTAVSIGWGLLVGFAVLGRGTRIAGAERVRAITNHDSRRSRRKRGNTIVERVVRDAMARFGRRKTDRMVDAQVPMVVELFAVAIGSGCSVIGAVDVLGQWSPHGVAIRFQRVSREFRMGEPLGAALRRLGRSGTSLGNLGELLADGAVLGTPLIRPLDRFATEQRAALRRQAEARARVVPVRLLFPLVFLILPAFGLITVVPAIEAGLRGG